MGFLLFSWVQFSLNYAQERWNLMANKHSAASRLFSQVKTQQSNLIYSYFSSTCWPSSTADQWTYREYSICIWCIVYICSYGQHTMPIVTFVCLIYANRLSKSPFAEIRLFILTPFMRSHAPFFAKYLRPIAGGSFSPLYRLVQR